jgi:hypothetical protein
MRRLLVKILQILDGTPAVYGKREQGQSVVELALITPILIVLFAGLVEIGWFANNYLTLMDVARAGARRAATLQDDLSAISWEWGARDSTFMAIADLPADYQANGIGVMPEIAGQDVARRAHRDCDLVAANRLFYDSVACAMIASLDPLSLRPENGIDDIIISGFALEMIDPRNDEIVSGNQPWLSANRPITSPDPNVPQMVVVGRYPSNANECDVIITDLVTGTPVLIPLESRDPFDFNGNNFIDVYVLGGSGTFLNTSPSTPWTNGGNIILSNFNWYVANDDFSEVYGGFPEETGSTATNSTLTWGYDPIAGNITDAEKQVGFVWTGNHRIDGTNCIGSEWTMRDMEDLFNLNSFITDPNDRALLPGQGVALVEIYWQHKLLLNFPIFNPFYTMLGATTTISVWAAFPMQPVDPNIVFELDD